jgi:hypothetical protein
MVNIATKVRIGTAACAIAAAATLVPLPTAQAAPAVPAAAAPVTQVLGAGAILGPANLAETNWWWFGTPNPNPPPRTTFLTVQPLLLLPGFIRPFFGWFAALNFEICFAGLSKRIGPYGVFSESIGKGC